MKSTALRIASFALIFTGASAVTSCCKCTDSGSSDSANIVHNPGAPAGLGMCAWLVGKWSGPLGSTLTEEEWRVEGSKISGEGRTLRDGQIVFTEKFHIEETETGDVVYVARPQGSPAPTSFTMTDSTATLLRFENKEHDFPKVIRYEFDGVSKMKIHLEGHENGKFQEMDYTLERAK